MNKNIANFLLILGYYLIVIPLLLEVDLANPNIFDDRVVMNGFESGLNFSHDRLLWLSTPAPEIVSTEHFEGLRSLRVYEDVANFGSGKGAQLACGFDEPVGGTYHQLRMLFDTNFNLSRVDQICFMSIGKEYATSLFLATHGTGDLSLNLLTSLPSKTQYSYNLTGQLQNNTWYTFAINVNRGVNGNIQAFFGDEMVINSEIGDTTAMDSNIINCGWGWGNHLGNIYLDDVQVCELGAEKNPSSNPLMNPDSSLTLPQRNLTLTFGKIIGGSVTLSHGGHDPVLVSSGDVYSIDSGTELAIMAYPEEGMRLARWRINGVTVNENSYTWTFDEKTTLNVVFKPLILIDQSLPLLICRIIEIMGVFVVVFGVIIRSRPKSSTQ